MSEKLEFRFDLLKGQTTIIEALDEASKKATGFKAVIGEAGDGTSFLKLASAVALGTAALEAVKVGVEKFVDVLHESVHAAIEKENAINRLNNALAQTGKYSAHASEDIQAFAEQMRKTTRYSDEQVLSNAALLQSLTYLDTSGLKKATKASADLAATLGMDLDTATRLVAKSIEGNSVALTRYGIQVKKGATESENFANTMRALSQFSGRAEADANTFGGAMDKTGNALHEVYTEIGNLIIKNPVFIEIIKELGKAFNKLSEYIKDNQDAIIDYINGGIKEFGKALIQLSPPFDFFIQVVFGAVEVLNIFTQALITVGDIINKFIAGVLNTLIDIPKGYLKIINLATELTARSETLSKILGKVGINIDGINESLDGSISEIEEIQTDIDDTSEAFSLMGKDARTFFGNISERSKTFLAGQVGLLDTLGQKVIKFADDSVKKTKDAVEEIENEDPKVGMTFLDKLREIFSSYDSLVTTLGAPFVKSIKTGLSAFDDALLESGPKLLAGITKGAEGARLTFVGLADSVFSKIPIIGQALSSIFDMFTRGPEYTKAMIKGFILGIPDIIQNIILSIPALIEGIIEAIPELLNKIADMLLSGKFLSNLVTAIARAFFNAPKIFVEGVLNLLKNLPKMLVDLFVKEMPRIIGGFISGAAQFVAAILTGAVQFVWYIVSGAASFVGTILSGAVNFVGQILAGAAQFVAEIVSNVPVIGDILGGGGDSGGGIPIISDLFDWNRGGLVETLYAAKGMMIKPFQPKGTDTVPSMLTPGEYVVDRSTTNRLNSFLDQQQSSNKSDYLLDQILTELKKPQVVNSELTLNRRTLADVILELNRNNARLA
jgi:hypothetical protein